MRSLSTIQNGVCSVGEHDPSRYTSSRILTRDDTTGALRGTASRQPPPSKRRKLTSSATAETAVETPQNQSVTTALIVSGDTRVHVSKVLAAAGGRLVCMSCHRAISVRPECIILCARCASPTCPVCSRTCTAPPPSQPPTPHLTYSPTPTTTPSLPPTPLPLPTPLSPSASPRRTALGLTSLNINNASFSGPLGVNGAGGGRRRKFKDEEWNLEAAGEGEGKVDEDGSKGCGRVMCKGCCEESWQSGSTTCWDCYDRI